MSERKMEIMVLEMEDVKKHLNLSGYGIGEEKWADENWEYLCDYAEKTLSLKPLFRTKVMNQIAAEISSNLGTDEYICDIQRISGCSIKTLDQFKDSGPNGEDLFIINTNKIPISGQGEHFIRDDYWDDVLDFWFNEDSEYSYSRGSVNVLNDGESLSISFEVYY